MIRPLLATILIGATVIAFAYGMQAFVKAKIGGPPPCEVSNTCGGFR